MTTTITPLSKDLQSELQEEINFKTKPIGALGNLEKIAMQVGLIQNTTTPVLSKPTIMVFAGDHGIATTGKVSPYPQEVTQQMVFNFLQGGAAINVFCKQNNILLNIVDAGVNADFEAHPQLTNAKIAKGTQDYSTTKAMTSEQCQEALEKGRQLVRKVYSEGCNVIGFGEMGISNTSSAALLMSYFTNTPIENCVGRGTGVDDKGLQTKIDTLREVYNLHIEAISTPMEALTAFGGFEIVMMCGAMLEAASLKMTLLIDGFIVTAALLAAHAMESDILDYCIFCHNSGEQGHQKMLEFLNAEPLLNLGLRLGEGTGCAVAFPIIQSSVNFLNEMATFKSANVSEA
ncbi:nicotinate-nucleotide--dimethylbenzimidazole phosphoribosyltransferase [Tenacibaculum ascidiaceicola]|uniref:nicotinate-nucleotide--dimethylbenzimidazole phosphoribosyltransferase n=1 Tax=Tenacibaculum ascidiaceicola TaxID=1699411 RepID=UPI0039E96D72